MSTPDRPEDRFDEFAAALRGAAARPPATAPADAARRILPLLPGRVEPAGSPWRLAAAAGLIVLIGLGVLLRAREQAPVQIARAKVPATTGAAPNVVVFWLDDSTEVHFVLEPFAN